MYASMNFWLVSSSVMLLGSMRLRFGRKYSVLRSTSGLYIGRSKRG